MYFFKALYQKRNKMMTKNFHTSYNNNNSKCSNRHIHHTNKTSLQSSHLYNLPSFKYGLYQATLKQNKYYISHNNVTLYEGRGQLNWYQPEELHGIYHHAKCERNQFIVSNTSQRQRHFTCITCARSLPGILIV